MRWPSAVAVAVLLPACVGLETQTRVERGPLLGRSARQTRVSGSRVQAKVSAQWPTLELLFERFDVCRDEQVETYAEDVVTERSAPGFGSALALGASGTLLGGGLLAARPLFSGEVDPRRIDGGGHLGPSARQRATGWGIGALVVGLPALTVAVVSHLRSGRELQTRKVEEVVSARETPCGAVPADGRVTFLGSREVPAARSTVEGRVRLTAEELMGKDFDTVLLDGQTAVAEAPDAERLSAFGACLELASGKAPPPEREALAEECALIPGAPAAAPSAPP